MFFTKKASSRDINPTLFGGEGGTIVELSGKIGLKYSSVSTLLSPIVENEKSQPNTDFSKAVQMKANSNFN